MPENETNQSKSRSEGTTRRGFMASTATLGAGLLLARKSVAQDKAAEAGPTPGTKELNVALIGLGAQGMVLMSAALRIPGLRFKAVCDIWGYSQTRGSRTLKRYGHDVNVYEDYRELLAQEKDLDVAIVATPDFMHAEHAIACMDAGLHVYCEKEMSNSLEKAKAMVLKQRETGKALQIGHQRRSNPRYKHAIDRMIRDEALVGRVTQGYGQWNRAKSEDLGWPKRYEIPEETLAKYGYDSMQHFRNWRWYRKYGGGPIVDLGSHQIDIFNWVFGTHPKSVMASGGVDFYPHHEWYDNVMAVYEYETEQGVARAFYQVLTTTSNGGFYENFMGVDGTLVISEVPQRGNHFLKEAHADQERWEQLARAGLLDQVVAEAPAGDATDVNQDVRVSKPLGAWDLPVELDKPVHQPHLENFFDAVREGTPLNCPAEVGYETAVEVLKVNEAVEANRVIEFGPGEFTV
ncbi:MAG: Gfo/Idh/MocA family oxidoreductase [bacterium]|nr:Gfo/Idh/MocA family oxidoreductase [bacterium]